MIKSLTLYLNPSMIQAILLWKMTLFYPPFWRLNCVVDGLMFLTIGLSWPFYIGCAVNRCCFVALLLFIQFPIQIKVSLLNSINTKWLGCFSVPIHSLTFVPTICLNMIFFHPALVIPSLIPSCLNQQLSNRSKLVKSLYVMIMS